MAKKKEQQAEPMAGAELEVMDPLPRAWEADPELTDRREHPVEVREEFLRRVLEDGEHLSLVAREMDIPVSTVEHWIAEVKHEREPQLELENIRLVDRLGKVSYELLDGLDKNKIAKAGVKDLAVALGIIMDKRKDLLGPRKGSSTSRLRIAWQGGTGAVEVETGYRE